MPVIIVPLSEITRLMNSIESQNGREQTSSRMTKKMRMLPSRPYEHEIPEELRARGCISMREATERSGYSLHYIGTLLRNGNIAGEKFSGRGLWAPNEEDLARYINEFGIDQASYSKETGLSIIRCSLSEKDKKNNPLKKRRRGRYNGAARIDEKDTADWITLRNAAEISGLKTPLLRKLCSLGSFLCARKINRSWVLRRDEFMKVFGPFGLLVGNTLLKATPDKQKKYEESVADYVTTTSMQVGDTKQDSVEESFDAE